MILEFPTAVTTPARALLAAMLLTLPAPGNAGPAAGSSDLAIPGGRSTLRLAGVPDSTPRGTALGLAIRLLHADPPGSTEVQDERLARVRTRLRQLGRLQAAVAEYGGEPLTLHAAGSDEVAGRAWAVLSAMGLRVRKAGDTYRTEADPEPEAVALREALADAGMDVSAVADTLNAGAGVRPAVPSLTVPLPLEPSTWSTIVLEPSVRGVPLVEAIFLDRQAALAACGLLSMDAATREWLAAHPSVLKRITYRAGTLCAFGRRFAIAGGVVRLPGGDGAVASWGALAGAPASEPERFVPALFTRDEGRLAYYYDVVSGLAPSAQAAALAILPDGVPDLELLKDTYEPFVESTGLWRPYDRPFLRPLFDAALLLDDLSVGADGVPLGPRWLRFWGIAFADASLPDQPSQLLRSLEDDGPIHVGALIRQALIANVDERRARFEQIAFVQRTMPAPADATLPDVLVAMRGFARFPALMLQLERLGAAAPSLLAAAARRAAVLDGIGDGSRRYQALAQLQGVLALLDGAVAARFLQAGDAARLVASLVAVENAGDEYQGAVARWIDRHLLPALGAAGSASPEAAALRAWSGPRERASRPIDWEGHRYTVDPADAELERLAKLRAIQGPSGLDAVVALTRATSAIGEAATIEAVKASAGALAGATAGLAPIANASLPEMDPIDEVVARAAKGLGRVKKVESAKDARAVAAALAPVWRHVDRSLAQALVSLAYTRHLGDPDASVLTGDDMAARHDFGRTALPSPAWSRPRDSGDETGRHLHGAVLGLDLALARLSLRRLSADAVPPARTANENVVDEVRQGVVLSFRYPPSDADLATVAGALDAGRRRIQAAGADARALEALASESLMSESRRMAIAWMAHEEPDLLPALFSLGEQYRLGTKDELPIAFGAGAADLGGCWCLRVMRARPWEDVSARPGQPRVAAHVPDFGLRLAAEMHALGVPATLYPALLAFAAEEFLDRASTRFPEDWPALVTAASGLSRERVEDYVSGLAGAGPLRMQQEPTR